MQMGALAPKGAAAETSPLLQYASAHSGSYDGSSPSGWPGAAPGIGSPVPPELHRCRRAYGPRPLVVASIAIGAGSFAQGCAPGNARAPALRAGRAAASRGLLARALRSCRARCGLTRPSPRRRYDGTAIGFLLTNGFGGWLEVRPASAWRSDRYVAPPPPACRPAACRWGAPCAFWGAAGGSAARVNTPMRLPPLSGEPRTAVPTPHLAAERCRPAARSWAPGKRAGWWPCSSWGASSAPTSGAWRALGGAARHTKPPGDSACGGVLIRTRAPPRHAPPPQLVDERRARAACTAAGRRRAMHGCSAARFHYRRLLVAAGRALPLRHRHGHQQVRRPCRRCALHARCAASATF